MKNKMKCAALLLSATALSGMMTMTAFAAKSGRITSIRLEIKDSMQPGDALGEDEALSIEPGADNYSVKSWEIENGGYTWQYYDIPRVTVTVATEDENYFSVPQNGVRIKGDEANVYAVYSEEPQVLTITLNLRPMSRRVGGIEDAWLDGTVASWTPAIGAESYDIYLYRDERPVGSRKTTSDTTFDFGTAMRKDGEYYYKVRAAGGEGVKEGKFTESDSVYISPSDTEKQPEGEAKPLNNSERVPGQWIQNEKGWRFTNTDGSRPVNDWACSGDKWYYFGADGYMVTGWIQWEGKWYYLGPEGDMQTNTLTPDGYIVDENGARVW